jgi:hypothetical protein
LADLSNQSWQAFLLLRSTLAKALNQGFHAFYLHNYRRHQANDDREPFRLRCDLLQSFSRIDQGC